MVETKKEKKYLSNIKYLLKQKNLKLGDLEKEIDVSPGYFSRFSAPNSSPSLDSIVSAANYLDCTIEMILNYDFEELNENELLLYRFMQRVVDKTIAFGINWDFFKKTNKYNNHPIYLELIDKNPSNEKIYKSRVTNETHEVLGNIYWFRHKNDIYSLSKVKGNGEFENDVIYEIYLFSHNVENICSLNSNSKNDLYMKIKELYKCVELASRQFNLSLNVKNAMNSFLTSTQEDELPF